MSITTEDRQQITSDNDARATGSTDVELWLKKIKAAQDEEKDWRASAKNAIKVYEADEQANTHFNLFHSNVQTTLPALYNTTPVSDARRRFNDKDPVGKMAVDIIERSIAYSVDQYPFDKYIRAAQKDGEVAGRGTARLRVNHQVANGQVIYSEVKCEPVKWDRWGRGPGQFWEEVPFIWFEHDLDKEDIEALIGNDPEKIKRVVEEGFGDGQNRDAKDQKADKGIYKTLKVYEVWCKKKREILFIAEKIKDFPLHVEPDVLGLDGFYPVPAPLQPIERLGSLVPVTPFDIYKHLLAQLDKTSKRISKLIDQLKVRGIVALDLIDDFEALKRADDGQYLSAKNALALAQGSGGLEKAIAHWPMDPAVQAIKQLIEQREQLKQLIYEVTGISDILRGAVDPREKLGQSQIKTQWGSLRLQDRQAEVARFCRDLFRMKTELISKFQPHVLQTMTGLPQTEQDQQLWPQAIKLLGDNLMRRFRVDIETDSTVRADMSRSQEQMNLFMTATAQFVQGLQQAAMIAPQFLPAMIEVYLAFARRFKLGKQAEDAIESLSQMAPQLAAMAQQQQQVNPEVEKAKLENERKAQEHQQNMQFEKEKHQQAMEFEREKQTQAINLKREEQNIQAEMDRDRMQREYDLEDFRATNDNRRAEDAHNSKLEIAREQSQAKIADQQMLADTKAEVQRTSEARAQSSADASQGMSALAQGLEILAKEQREASQATLQVITQLVNQIAAGAQKPKGKTFKRAIRGQDGKVIGLLEDELMPAEGVS